jgi:hypothetical protein
VYVDGAPDGGGGFGFGFPPGVGGGGGGPGGGGGFAPRAPGGGGGFGEPGARRTIGSRRPCAPLAALADRAGRGEWRSAASGAGSGWEEGASRCALKARGRAPPPRIRFTSELPHRLAGAGAIAVTGDASRLASALPIPPTAPLPGIVKDVRGSESNCEQDSRKM